MAATDRKKKYVSTPCYVVARQSATYDWEMGTRKWRKYERKLCNEDSLREWGFQNLGRVGALINN